MKTDTWHEQGPWLLLLVIPLAAFAFRKGYIVVLLLFLLPLPHPAQAMSWDELWKNNNQRAAEKLSNNDPQAAAELFSDPQWQAAAHYRAGNFDQAAQSLTGINNSDAHYNRGNALAKLGKIDDAINAYDEALHLNPKNEDALYNKEQLQKQKQQQPSNQQQKDSSGKDKPGDQKQDKSGEQQSGQDKSGDKASSNQNKSDNSDSEQQQSNNDKSDQKDKEQPNNTSQPARSDPAKQDDKANEQAQQAASSADKPDLTQQATEQWLRKIPDDPGGLLRRKFKNQYQQQSKESQGSNSW